MLRNEELVPNKCQFERPRVLICELPRVGAENRVLQSEGGYGDSLSHETVVPRVGLRANENELLLSELT
jgi:hypothetical protein